MLTETSRPIACVAWAARTRTATSSRMRSRTALPSSRRWSRTSVADMLIDPTSTRTCTRLAPVRDFALALEARMRIPLAFVLVVALPAVALGQEKLPPDINPQTLSRMPPINRAELDAEGQKALDARATAPMPAPGPGAVTVWSPRATEGLG